MDMVTISEEAADALRKLLASKGAGPQTGLRLGVSRGGCAGWKTQDRVSGKEISSRVAPARAASYR